MSDTETELNHDGDTDDRRGEIIFYIIVDGVRYKIEDYYRIQQLINKGEKMSDDCCLRCKYWKKDYGIWCFNGWTGADKDDGYCHYEPKKYYKKATDFCSKFDVD